MSHTQHHFVTSSTRQCHTLNITLSHLQHDSVTHSTSLCHILNTTVSHTQHHFVTSSTRQCHTLNITLSHPQHDSVTHSTSHCHLLNTTVLNTQHRIVTLPHCSPSHVHIRMRGISNYKSVVSPPLVPTRTEQTKRVNFQYRLLLLVTTALLYDITTFSIVNVCKLRYTLEY